MFVNDMMLLLIGFPVFLSGFWPRIAEYTG
jgi:hypothetical protein